MRLKEFSRDLSESLCGLLNQQIESLVPKLSFEQEQLARIIEQGVGLWDLHYQEGTMPCKAEVRTICAVENQEVMAAMQFLLPEDGKIESAILWIVSVQKNSAALDLLLNEVLAIVGRRENSGINFSRFSFGIGWFGIPANWHHVVDSLKSAGFCEKERWVLMHAGVADCLENLVDLNLDELSFVRQSNEDVLEWKISVADSNRELGSCEIWGIPPHISREAGAADWMTIEWIEVDHSAQRRGIGQWLMLESMRFLKERGVRQVAAWTELSNLAARRLNEKLGFVNGMELSVLELRSRSLSKETGSD